VTGLESDRSRRGSQRKTTASSEFAMHGGGVGTEVVGGSALLQDSDIGWGTGSSSMMIGTPEVDA